MIERQLGQVCERLKQAVTGESLLGNIDSAVRIRGLDDEKSPKDQQSCIVYVGVETSDGNGIDGQTTQVWMYIRIGTGIKESSVRLYIFWTCHEKGNGMEFGVILGIANVSVSPE